jgi:signal peptide peptidase SppA
VADGAVVVQHGGLETSILSIEGGKAVIEVQGQILRSIPPIVRMLGALGVKATSTEEVISALMAAAADPQVFGIEMRVNSPGGTVDGLLPLVAAMRAVNAEKPIVAIGDGQVASAAYWIASQADAFYAQPGTQVGSIGTYVALADSSELHTANGIKVHVLRSGPYKGVGTPGTQITDEQLAGIQSMVDDIAAEFISHVAEGRGMTKDQATALATGQVWLADKALSLGLIDGIESVTLTAPSAQKGASMELDKKLEAALARVQALEEKALELETVKAQLVAAEAKEAASQEALIAIEATQKKDLIDLAIREGRAVPAERPHLETFALSTTVSDLEKFLAVRPKIVRSEGEASAAEPAPKAQPQIEADADMKKYFRALGLSEADVLKGIDAAGVEVTGHITLATGEHVDEWGDV